MTYAGLVTVFLAIALVVLVVVVVVCRPGRTWWLATAATVVALAVLTVVFDSLMIALDLFRYDEGALSGVRLGLAPVEDLAWPVAAVGVLPALWLLLGRSDR